MKRKEILKKLNLFIVLVLFGFVFSYSFSGDTETSVVQAKSVKKTMEKAKKAYVKKMNSIAENYSAHVRYRIIDITGDKIPECLAQYVREGKRHGTLKAYTYKKGKLKKILDIKNDNLNISLYRKTKTLTIGDSYHDYRDCGFYQYRNGRFRLKAKKCYNSASETKTWYENSSGRAISKKKFNRSIKPLKKGKKKNLDYDNWSGIYYETEY